MNLQPPPEFPIALQLSDIPDSERVRRLLNWVAETQQWMKELYEFLQFPHFEVVRFISRSAAPTEDGEASGVVYYDSDDNKLKAHNGTDFQDTY